MVTNKATEIDFFVDIVESLWLWCLHIMVEALLSHHQSKKSFKNDFGIYIVNLLMGYEINKFM